MATDIQPTSPDVEESIEDLKIKSEVSDNDLNITPSPNFHHSPTDLNSDKDRPCKISVSSEPSPKRDTSNAIMTKSESPTKEETLAGDITVKSEPGKPLKLSRSASHKVLKRNLPLFNDLPSKTAEATSIFQVIQDCTYQNKNLGLTDDDSFECECSPEWGK